jgi:hypothetical protein
VTGLRWWWAGALTRAEAVLPERLLHWLLWQRWVRWPRFRRALGWRWAALLLRRHRRWSSGVVACECCGQPTWGMPAVPLRYELGTCELHECRDVETLP